MVGFPKRTDTEAGHDWCCCWMVSEAGITPKTTQWTSSDEKRLAALGTRGRGPPWSGGRAWSFRLLDVRERVLVENKGPGGTAI